MRQQPTDEEVQHYCPSRYETYRRAKYTLHAVIPACIVVVVTSNVFELPYLLAPVPLILGALVWALIIGNQILGATRKAILQEQVEVNKAQKERISSSPNKDQRSLIVQV
jgi:hypothetical protein